MNNFTRFFLSLLVVFAMVHCKGKTSEQNTGQEVGKNGALNIYSSRHYDVDKKIYQQFTEETGIAVNLVEGKGDEILQRILQEKDNSQADLYLTVGAENIYPLAQENLVEPFTSNVIEKNIPEQFRGNGWTGITSRARVIAYVKERTDPSVIKTYKDLIKPEWKGKILVRSSGSSYNIALLASFIAIDGKVTATEWAKGMVANFARDPKGNDRDQAKAMVAGDGEFAVINSYYLVKMLNSSDLKEVEVGKQVGLIFPENTHLNLSFGMLLKSAKNKENAVRFLEFVTDKKIQKIYAEKNGEFALNPEVPLTEIQSTWQKNFSKQKLNFEELGKYKKDASFIFDEVGWK